MNIYYQGIPGSYSYIASTKIQKNLNDIQECIGLKNFNSVWQHIQDGNIGVLPIENSYAGSIQTNIQNFLRYNFTIIGEFYLPIHHCLLAKTTDINKLTKAYSHPQAIAQCFEFLKENNLAENERGDTAGAAKKISEGDEDNYSAIASKECAELYNLKIVKESIEDQKGNTTRFVIVSKNKIENTLEKVGKTSLIFEAKHMSGSLYKCLGCFATNGINLTKIESLPSHKSPFHYMFWVDFHGTPEDENIKQALKELEFYADNIKIIGSY